LTPIKGFNQVKGVLIVTDHDTNQSFQEVATAFTVNGHKPPAAANAVGLIYGKPAAILMIPSDTVVWIRWLDLHELALRRWCDGDGEENNSRGLHIVIWA
jgi:hypothetical protein